MALYDNRHWLLSHIRNSFISSDDTGISEMVMLGEDIPRKLSSLSKFDCYPGVNESDEEDELDAMGQSFDLESDMDYGVMRQRSNTAQRLEKMDQERKKAGRIKHIKWESSPITLSDQERAELFQRKNFKQEKRKEDKETKQSLLSEQLEKCPHMPQNPFVEYAKYDGSAQVGTPTRKYGIFLTMLEGPEKNYPMHVVVVASAKVQDLIGLICWKYTMEHGLHKLKDSVDYYGLFIAEDDGEVDWDFPCIDPRETVGKFGFTYLALVEVQKKEESEAKSDSNRECELESWSILPDHGAKAKAQQQDWEDQILMKGHMTAMEAPLYQSYRVYILNKVRTKTEIHLGISGEKVEIDPVIQQKVSAKFWNRQKAVSYDMDNIAACDLIDAKSSNRSTFRLVYHHAGPSSSSDQQGDSSHQPTYKHHDFEAERHVAEEIVQKVNHILELRSSVRRKEYLALRERKSHRKRSFHLGPR